MSQKDIDFLIEQILEDANAGYLVERAKWRKMLDNGETGRNGEPVAYYRGANGDISPFRKGDVNPNNTKDDALFYQNTDDDKKHTQMHKYVVDKALNNALKYNELSPEDVAQYIKVELRNAKGVAVGREIVIKPEAALQLCRSYIQSALASAQGAKKKQLLMLLKTVKSPEFLKALKKKIGKSIFKPWTWFSRTDKPNTKGRLADV